MKRETVRILAFLALHLLAVISTGLAFHLTDWRALVVGCVALIMPILWQVLSLLAANGTITAKQVDTVVTAAIAANPPTPPNS